MLLRQFLAVHQIGQHHVVLHGASERNAVVVAVMPRNTTSRAVSSSAPRLAVVS